MTFNLVTNLRQCIVNSCPVDTGQLRAHIQPAQGNETCWVIIIGQDSGEINGTPSNRYASITNDSRTVGKYGRVNPNYKWLTNALDNWFKQNIHLLANSSVEEDDEV